MGKPIEEGYCVGQVRGIRVGAAVAKFRVVRRVVARVRYCILWCFRWRFVGVVR